MEQELLGAIKPCKTAPRKKRVEKCHDKHSQRVAIIEEEVVYRQEPAKHGDAELEDMEIIDDDDEGPESSDDDIEMEATTDSKVRYFDLELSQATS